MSILLENVSKRYEQQTVVNNVSLEIKDGEFFVLLGSSGSGKTTILNIIAGLASAEQGRVLLHDRDVTDLPTQKRNIGFVFQNYALFEYMTVAENIEFGLQIRKVPKKDRQLKRDELLELVGLVGLGDRMPRQLSGGQQQRVALARALVVDPDVLLLDEPLGALDAKIRVELRRSLKAIQRQLGVAAILVTHDQEEAFDLADRIGVMSYGRLVEVGTPQDLYQHPKTEFVASFLGTANILLGQTESDRIQIGPHIFKLAKDATRFSTDGRVQVVFRPEDLALATSESELDCTPLGEGTVTSLGLNGPTERIRLELPSIPGVRAIAPIVPFGSQNIMIEATRSPDQAATFPLSMHEKGLGGNTTYPCPHTSGFEFPRGNRWVFAQSIGDQPGKLSGPHGTCPNDTAWALGKDESLLDTYLQDARKQIGSGMASIEVRTDPRSTPVAIAKIIEKDPVDLAIVGWRPVEGTEIAEQILRKGDHHLLLAAHPGARIERALVCVASGEPGKDDVMFAGRLLRHLGARAKLFTVLPTAMNNEYQNRQVVRFVAGGVQTLEMFGVPTESELKIGDPQAEIVEEIKKGEFDLVVLGAPFPQKDGRILINGLIEGVMKNAGNCSVLIVRSHYHKNTVKHN